ncbi:efflux RND transporter periplasmic adaptor subunit [Photobacterium sp. DNB23_23_1]|uniref:Efflux RND transporter periplasmic adaptor subunit n=1 Tax=Photobacterium pectinilyticum TaxID=2906793 RepID=A0ABT1N6H8_9GAMM|nr:efflux RND transporter periplasmic adaptor subunit [Photobacterium sp. ZSDE20]MCQ1060348.1 efflux RND transporter periplasmic adaptor subunit [Photobacterium sp. ZSDE20]MDD1827671.1 efflux RND transporter periplasmic adaptor subunit [Photobacterium sp. ZSDE20]
MHLPSSLKLPLCLLLSSALLLGCGEQEIDQRPAPGPPHVDVLDLTPTTLRLTTELPGRIAAFKQAEVRPQVTGILKSRLYKEGSQVEAGDVLYEIDPTIYQSNVNSAQAQLTKALASEKSSRKTAVRYQELLKKKLTSQENFDAADASYKEAQAEVAISQAELDYANVELSYTKIKAPISGQAGLSMVSEGSLLTAEQSSYLTTIVQTSNVYVDMQQSSLAITKIRKEFASFTDKNAEIPVSITLEDGSAYDEVGHLEFSDTLVSDSTGTVTLRAIIPNPNNLLLGGMYVRAHISMPEARDYLVVPQSAVVRSQSGEPSVFVVSQDNKTVKKPVVIGNEVGNGWVVKEGLVSGEQVVISNIINMKNDIAVVVDSSTESTTPTTVSEE